ncbi:SDR family oxidoreductase [Aurantimonas sp. HBX-1]|uniref:SDR family oxidoreductase n=1 Tax=Aurantimonas sp. HBX-1 TaxID=2906072 RepID=UPI001F31F005|nr:SDR family NAD(P)-dependent oxidoreductase [Aurantimonas sp. HBX-1]UIJ71108.1 SDR family NAD(P)-dependent oxidoreductase [Aurantimonas sp. HBX-1]
MKTTGNTILITGGGTGIGEALAHRFHDLGNTVIIAGRRMETLDKAIGNRPNIHALTFDQNDPTSIAAFTEKLVTDFPKVNVLFNSAGIMRMEGALDTFRDLGDAEASVTSNLLGPIRLTNALIEHLVRQPDAVIVNVSSGLAFVPLVIAPTYSAIKAAIHNYTESLRAVLKGKVEVIELVPPAVRTSLTPGQQDNERFMPLDAFADQAMARFQQTPTPREILVEGVDFMRNAEAEGRFDDTLAAINPFLK